MAPTKSSPAKSSTISPKDFKPSPADIKDAPRRIKKILPILRRAYPDAKCALLHKNPLQLLVATILSAQCTDERVNIVTRDLFAKYRHVSDYAGAPLTELENEIRSTGFFRNKARNLILCAQEVLVQHKGEVPQTLEELVALAGVGRKTANVVLGDAYQVPGMVVDTHVKRLANRFGWTKSDNPVQIERELGQLLPAEVWTQAGHTLIAHGRACCKAPTPICSRCPVVEFCPRIGVERSR